MHEPVERVAALTVALLCGWGLSIGAQGALAALGVKEAEARIEALSALDHGFVNVYVAAGAVKAAPPATRAAMVKAAIGWARTYTESAAFKADYQQRRAASAPTAPTFDKTVDEELAAERAKRQKEAEESRKSLAAMPPDMRAQMEPVLKMMEAQNAKMDNDPQQQAMARQGLQEERANKMKAYQESVREHDLRFPADPRVLIARRLQEFLDRSKDVDFNASLVTADGVRRFADPRYEAKPFEWKLCYRTGRETVAAAREAAQAWLTALK